MVIKIKMKDRIHETLILDVIRFEVEADTLLIVSGTDGYIINHYIKLKLIDSMMFINNEVKS